MDYVEGRDLKSLLVERGKLPPEEAVPIIQQVCRGLEAAHTEGDGSPRSQAAEHHGSTRMAVCG